MYKTIKIRSRRFDSGSRCNRNPKGRIQGPSLKKGHKIAMSDICHLQRLGKRHIYVLLDLPDEYMHEDDAALIMADAFCGPGVIHRGEPKEGKLNLYAERDGLLKINVTALTRINMLEKVMCATRHTNTLIKRGDIVAGTRTIPLVLKKDIVQKAVGIARSHDGIAMVKSLRKAKAGIVITGNEVFTRLIEDQFEPILCEKINRLGSEVMSVTFSPDDPLTIADKIKKLLSIGADLILTTGGMSVDPDDVTRKGIQMIGGETDCYGAPILPGAMFLIAYVDDVPILGVPACGLYHKTTILDLILPQNITERLKGSR